MIRQYCAAGLAMLVAVICTLADSQPTEAQGLLRRLQYRIQSRIQPLPAPPPVAVPRRSEVPPPTALPPRSGVQRVSPLPRAADPNLSSRSAMDPSRQTVRPASGQSPVNDDLDVRGEDDSAAQREYGSSILNDSSGNQPPAQPEASDDRFDPADPSGAADQFSAQYEPNPADQPDPADPQRSSVSRPSLGIDAFESRRGVPGVEVARFHPDSQADDAGLQIGDVIVAVDGRATPTIAAVAQQLAEHRDSSPVRLRIVRGRSTTALMVPMMGTAIRVAKPQITVPDQSAYARPRVAAADAGNDAAPASNQMRGLAGDDNAGGQVGSDSSESLPAPAIAVPALGVETTDMPAVRGVVVTLVVPNSPAAISGLMPGDRIVSVEGRLVRNATDLQRELARLDSQRSEPLPLQIVRSGKLVRRDIDFNADPATATAANDPPATPGSQQESVLGGFGSMLGGLLGSQQTDNSAATTAPPAIEKELPRKPPPPVPTPPRGPAADRATQPLSQDEMAFGDDEPVLPVGFDSEIEPREVDRPRDAADQQIMELPPPEKATSAGDAEKLREEIRQLELRLQELEGQQN